MGAHRGRLEQRLWPHFLLAAEQARRKSAGWREGPCPHPWAPDLGLAYLHYGSSRGQGTEPPGTMFLRLWGAVCPRPGGGLVGSRPGRTSLGLGLYQGPLTSSCLLSEKRPLDRLTHVCLSRPGVGNPASGLGLQPLLRELLSAGPKCWGPVVSESISVAVVTDVPGKRRGTAGSGGPLGREWTRCQLALPARAPFAHSVGHLQARGPWWAGCSRRDESQGSLPRPLSWRKMVVLCCGWRGVSFRLSGISLCELRKCCVLSGWGERRQNSPSGMDFSVHFISFSAVFPASSGVLRRDPALQRPPDVLEAAVHRGCPCVGAPRPPSWPPRPLAVEMVIT